MNQTLLRCTIFFLSLLIATLTWAQVPTIASFTPRSASAGASITATGLNFSTIPSQNIVYMAGVKAIVTAATATQLTIQVPLVSSYGLISITVNGLTGTSREAFVPLFSGSERLVGGSFECQKDLVTSAPSSFYSPLAIADIDNDGKPDLIATTEGNTMSVFLNTSTAGSGSVSAPINFTCPQGSSRVAIADMDGDGLLDIVVLSTVSTGNGSFSVFRNISTPGNVAMETRQDVNFPTSNNPIDIRLGDIDGDGKKDVVVTRFLVPGILIYRNINTVGNISASLFQPGFLINTTSFPALLSLTDLDGDNKVDLIFSFRNSNEIRIIRNVTTSPGTISNANFATSFALPTFNSTNGLSVADMDADGKPDIIISNENGDNSSISVYKNIHTGASIAGSFNTRVNFFGSPDPTVTQIADFDGDGKPDIAVRNRSANAIGIFRNLTTSGIIDFSSFASPVNHGVNIEITVGSNLVVADLDMDGKPDLIPSNGTNTSVIAFLRNIITQPRTLSIVSVSPLTAAVGSTVTITGTNFNPVANENLVYFGATRAVVNSATATTLIVQVPNGATYESISVTSCGLSAYSPECFLVTRVGSGIVDLTTFEAPVNFAAGMFAQSVAVGDLDGDGKSDLVVSNSSTATISLLRNTSTTGVVNASSFSAKVDIVTGANPNQVIVADLDGDGKLDIAVTSENSSVISVHRNVSGTINNSSFAAKVDFSTSLNPYGIRAEDLDGDGRPELLVTNQQSNSISIFKNNSTPGIIHARSFDFPLNLTTGTNPTGITTGDINQDGKPDIVITNTLSNTLSLFQNTSTTGELSFSSRTDIPTAIQPFDALLRDIDNDGLPDLVVANLSSAVLSVYRNANLNAIQLTSFESPINYSITGGGSYKLAVDDIDGDGKADIAVNVSVLGVAIYKNNSSSGSISIASEVVFPIGAVSRGLALADIDGDGFPDAITANTNGTSSVFRNKFTVAAPTIISFTPNSGAEGTTVIINGTNFSATPANNTVNFNGVLANVTVSTTTSITTTVPLAATTGKITVTVAGNTATSASDFTVTTTSLPTIISFTPAAGIIGTTVTITGTNFSTTPANNTINFNGTPAVVAASTATSITTLVPSGATTGKITVTVAGNTATSASDFTVTTTSLPTIISFTPAAGITGATVTITGTNFSTTPANNTINFNGTPAVVAASTATSITTLVPSGATTGKITVTVAGNTATSASDFIVNVVTANQPPVIASSSSAVPINGIVTIDLLPLLSDPDDNLDLSTLSLNDNLSEQGAAASITAAFELVLDYGSVAFAGTDRISLSVCDLVGECDQQNLSIEVQGDVTIYNAISPNGDDLNKIFYIKYIDLLPETQKNKVTIYNRWGSLVFEVTDYNNTTKVFSGFNNNGGELPSGTYFYKIEFTNGKPNKTGYLALKR